MHASIPMPRPQAIPALFTAACRGARLTACRLFATRAARHLAATVLLGLLLAAPASSAATDFERDIAPLLIRRCLECHAGLEPAGGLHLTSASGILTGGDSGPALDASAADRSLLWRRVNAGEMPPKRQGHAQPLVASERDLLRDWIQSGAPWPANRTLDPFERSTDRRAGRDWWSLQAVQRPPMPAGARNPIDHFIQSDLAARGWTPAPAADRRTLIRRVSIDLTGIPPTYEEVEAFARDRSPSAYERLVDRLLDSPHFGERWARHWLDVARYAETCGYERDQPKPNVWKYRDWVVKAFNADLPYDRFILEQLAGDEIAGRSEASVTATGFLRLGTWNDEPNDPEEYKYERLEDMVHATSTAFLGLTVKCARCHDHKFDPVTQLDYHRMAAAFWTGYLQPGQGTLGGPDEKALGFAVFGWTDTLKAPPPLRLLKKGDPHRPLDPVPAEPMSILPALARAHGAPEITSSTSNTNAGRRLRLARWIADPSNPLTARVWVNRLWLHHFGRGLVRSPDNFGFNGDPPTHPQLLDWLAAELVAGGWRSKPLHRLMVLSETYRQSSLHPEQDRYAREDAANRLWWRAERRRLDADVLRDALLAAGGQLDLARIGGPSFSPDISADALEGLSTKSQAWTPSPPVEQRRRALYAHSKRSLLPPLATVFDAPDTTLPCGQRDITLVAPQALALLNNAFVHDQSTAIARRILAATPGAGRTARIRAAWHLTLARAPSAAERRLAERHLQSQTRRFGQTANRHGASPSAEELALASLAHVLLNSNEFMFVD